MIGGPLVNGQEADILSAPVAFRHYTVAAAPSCRLNPPTRTSRDLFSSRAKNQSPNQKAAAEIYPI